MRKVESFSLEESVCVGVEKSENVIGDMPVCVFDGLHTAVKIRLIIML